MSPMSIRRRRATTKATPRKRIAPGSKRACARSDTSSRTRARADPLFGGQQLLVFLQREAVGHARDVVGDHARDGFPLLAHAPRDVRRKLARLGHVHLEEG